MSVDKWKEIERKHQERATKLEESNLEMRLWIADLLATHRQITKCTGCPWCSGAKKLIERHPCDT